MQKNTTVYLGLGSNLGNRGENIRSAVDLISKLDGVVLSKTSDIIETDSLNNSSQPKYLNAVAQIMTDLPADKLLSQLQEIENKLSRQRNGKWSSRTIDLDILFFGSEIINSKDLIIPHTQLHLRSFVLNGLCQLDGDFIHPLLNEKMSVLAKRLNGNSFYKKPDVPKLISIEGVIGVGKTTLANKLTERLSSELILEPYDTNPFLPDVYAGKKELGLDSQLYFLAGRVAQLDKNILKANNIYISDYLFDKEMIYAELLLDNRQLNLYKDIYGRITDKVAEPSLVIYMYDQPQICLERIHKRNRPYEQNIQVDFLGRLHNNYEKLFENWKTSSVIRLSTSEFDCFKKSDIDCLINQIRYYI